MRRSLTALRSVRVLPALALWLLLVGTITAQSPLTTTFANDNQGSVGGCLYFDLLVNTPVVSTTVAMNFASPVGTPGSIDLYLAPNTRLGQQTNPATWWLYASWGCSSAGPGVPSVSTLPSPLVLPPGSHGVALVAHGVAFAYTNGNGTNQVYSTVELTLSAGEASNVPFTAPLFTPRVPNLTLHYSGAGTPLAGDECTTATTVQIGSTGPLSNSGYTTSSPPMCAAGGNDRWFVFTAPSTGGFLFHTCQVAPTNPVDTVLEVLNGACGSLTSLGCDNDTCGQGSRVVLHLAMGQTVYVRVGGYGGNLGNFVLTVDDVGADFTATPLSGAVPLNVQFTDQSTSVSSIVSWAWDLNGDSIVDSTQQNPSFTYTTAGAFSVTLTVSDGINPPSTLTRPNYITTTATAPGDDCATAIDVFVGDNGTFSNAGCTGAGISPQCMAAGPLVADCWFRFVPPYSWPFRFSLANASPAAQLELRDGSCGSQSSIACGTAVTHTLTGSNSYYVRVAGLGGATVNFTLRIRPADDECGGAIPIAIGTTLTSHGADYSASAAMICGTPTFIDRWFQFTPPFAAPYTVSGHGTSVVELVGSCGGTVLDCGLGAATATLAAGVPCLVRVGMAPGQVNPPVIVAPGKGPGTAPPGLVFNEIVYDDGGTGDEFIELYNTTQNTVNLAGYYVVAVTASSQTTVALATTANVAAGGFFVFGAGGQALLAPLPDGATSLRLHDASGALIDTLAYEGASGSLLPQFLMGHPLYGEHVRDPAFPGFPTSWSRAADGHTTPIELAPASDNGLEWRVMTSTRGASNSLPDLKSELVTSYENVTAVPHWSGCQATPTISSLPVLSPDGGQYAVFGAGPAGAGRSYFFPTAASDNFQLDTYVYLALPALSPGGRCMWSIGLCGTTDTNYEFPDVWHEYGVDRNGDTGVTWTYEVKAGSGLPVGTLTLIDNEAGGTDHIVLWQQTITTEGWLRLGLAVAPGTLNTKLGGNVGDGGSEEFERPHYAAYGGVYIGIRQNQPVNFDLRLDGTRIDGSWNKGDGTGPGCDGNCPPRNSSGGKLNRSVVPAQRTYAILLPDAGSVYTATKVSFYMAPYGRTQIPVPTVALCPNSGGVPGAALVTRDLVGKDQEWWSADVAGSWFPYTGYMWLVLSLPESMRPPILESRLDGAPLEDSDFSLWNGTSWIASGQAAFAIKWQCVDDSSGLKADSDTTENLDFATIDFRMTLDTLAPTPVVLALSFTALSLPLDGLGAPTCKLFVGLDSLSAAVASGGSQTLTLAIPNALPFIGTSIHSQWAALNPAYNPLGIHTTNRHSVTIR